MATYDLGYDEEEVGEPTEATVADMDESGEDVGKQKKSTRKSTPKKSADGVIHVTTMAGKRGRQQKTHAVAMTKLQKLEKKLRDLEKLNHPLAKSGVKKNRRWRPGTVALRQIKRYQKDTEPLIPKASVNRLLNEVVHEISGQDNKILMTKGARETLHESLETHLAQIHKLSNLLAVHAKRVSIQSSDIITAMEVIKLSNEIVVGALPTNDQMKEFERVAIEKHAEAKLAKKIRDMEKKKAPSARKK